MVKTFTDDQRQDGGFSSVNDFFPLDAEHDVKQKRHRRQKSRAALAGLHNDDLPPPPTSKTKDTRQRSKKARRKNQLTPEEQSKKARISDAEKKRAAAVAPPKPRKFTLTDYSKDDKLKKAMEDWDAMTKEDRPSKASFARARGIKERSF